MTTVTFQSLRHLQMMLQSRQCFAGPVLKLGIIAAFRVTLEQIDGVFVRAHLLRSELRGEVVPLVAA